MENLMIKLMKCPVLALLFVLVAIEPLAKANDGAFTLGVGGLEPISEPDIRIDSEKLWAFLYPVFTQSVDRTSSQQTVNFSNQFHETPLPTDK